MTVKNIFFSPFSNVNDEKIIRKSYEAYNKQISIRDNGNVPSHDQEGSKLKSTINANSGAHTLTHDLII